MNKTFFDMSNMTSGGHRYYDIEMSLINAIEKSMNRISNFANDIFFKDVVNKEYRMIDEP